MDFNQKERNFKMKSNILSLDKLLTHTHCQPYVPYHSAPNHQKWGGYHMDQVISRLMTQSHTHKLNNEPKQETSRVKNKKRE